MVFMTSQDSLPFASPVSRRYFFLTFLCLSTSLVSFIQVVNWNNDRCLFMIIISLLCYAVRCLANAWNTRKVCTRRDLGDAFIELRPKVVYAN